MAQTTIQMQVDANRVRIDTPYVVNFAKRASGGQLNGTWDRSNQLWVFDLNTFHLVQELYNRYFGTGYLALGSADATEVTLNVDTFLKAGAGFIDNDFGDATMVGLGRNLQLASSPIVNGVATAPSLSSEASFGAGGFEVNGNVIRFKRGTTIVLTDQPLGVILRYVGRTANSLAIDGSVDLGIGLWGLGGEHTVADSMFDATKSQNPNGSYDEDVKKSSGTDAKAPDPVPSVTKTSKSQGIQVALELKAKEAELVELTRGLRKLIQGSGLPQGILKKMLDDAGLAYADQA